MKWNRGFGLALRCFMRLSPWRAISTAATSAATNNSVCEGWAGTRQHMRETVLRLDDCRARVVSKQPKRQDISEGPPGEAVLPRLPVSKRLRDSPNPPSASASCPSHTVLAEGSSGHADTIDPCPTRPAAPGHLHDRAIPADESARVSLRAPMSRQVGQNHPLRLVNAKLFASRFLRPASHFRQRIDTP
jgi:hypothetical protein